MNPVDATRSEDLLQVAIRDNGKYDNEFRVNWLDGTEHIIKSNACVKKKTSGKIVSVVGINYDITERVKVEEALRISEKRFSNVIEGSQLGFWDWDLKTNSVYRNSRWDEMLGFSISEIGFNINQWKELQHPDDYVRAWELMQDHLNGVTTIYIIEYRMRTKTGQYKWILDRGTIVERDCNGKPIRMCGTLMDISDRKKIEDKLLDSEKRFKYAIHRAPFPLMIHAEDGEIIVINQTWTDLSGYSQTDIPTIHEWTEKAYDERKEIVREEFNSLHQFNYKNAEGEYKVHCKDGSFRLWDFKTVSLGRISDGRVFAITMATDITVRKNAEIEVSKLLGEKQIILKEVHHRIKNNMTTMDSLLSLQADALKDQSAINALENAKRRLKSMLVLYEKLYQSVNFTELPLGTYLSSLIDEIVENFPNVSTVKILKDLCECIVEVKILQQIGIIINELFSNIMKYAFVGRTEGLIMVSATNMDGHVAISVHDNGNGIPESVSFGNSTGFGLQLVQALTQQLGGTIRIERGNGTKVVLEFEI